MIHIRRKEDGKPLCGAPDETSVPGTHVCTECVEKSGIRQQIFDRLLEIAMEPGPDQVAATKAILDRFARRDR